MEPPMFDKVPGYNIYIGGFTSIRRPKALAECKITHIVSVIDWKFARDSPSARGYKHLHIPVNDMCEENLIGWFPKSNAFIRQGLDQWHHGLHECSTDQNQDREISRNSGVLIHCAMGKSRSATIILAYLLWDSHLRHSTLIPPTTRSAEADSALSQPRDTSQDDLGLLTPETALRLLRRGRALVEPNDGFMEQLELYHSMKCPSSIDDQPGYQRWLYRKTVQQSVNVHRAPDISEVLFEDEHEVALNAETSGVGVSLDRETEVRCRRCRHLLAKSNFLIDYHPPTTEQEQRSRISERKQCAHLFIQPLSWMRLSLEDGELDGRLACPSPKCGVNVGKFAWQGMRCSCGGWVTPGFGLARGKVDEVTLSPRKAGLADRSAQLGVRLPPCMRKENENPVAQGGTAQ